MRKVRRFVSYLLVFAMSISLCNGIVFKSESVKAASGAPEVFTVLEIVPNKEMATFGYLCDDYNIEYKDADNTDQKLSISNLPQINGKTVAENCLANGTLATYLTNNGYGTFEEGVYTSSNYFANNILPTYTGDNDEGWVVRVVTKTPSELTSDIIESANMVVINETVPTGLQISAISGKQDDKFYENDFSSWAITYKLFKKIAGIDGDPIPYLIDFSCYTSVRNNDWKLAKKGDQDRFGFIPADAVDRLAEEGQPIKAGGYGECDYGTGEQEKQFGSDAYIFKLFTMLASINPATFYGIYFASHDDDYGIDEDGNLLGVGVNSSKNVRAFNLGRKFSTWGEYYVRPNFLLTKSKNMDTILSDLGWIFAESKNSSTEFYNVIGGSTGTGILYNSQNDGLFFAAKAVDGSNNVFGNIINSYFTTKKNDYHPYRFLIICESSVDLAVNRSLIADMVNVANVADKGLVGGIRIDCMSKAQFDNLCADLDHTYDAIYYNGVTLSAKSSQKISNYLKNASSSDRSVRIISSGTRDSLITAFNNVRADSFGVFYVTVPTEYYSGYNIVYNDENGDSVNKDSYVGSGSYKVTDDLNFINNKYHSAKTLDFNISVVHNSDSTTLYTVELYVDRDHDDFFNSANINDNPQDGERMVLSSSLKAGKSLSKNVSIETFMGKDYVGGFSWKLVVRNNATKDEISRVGYSACKRETEKATIKVLQIYPTDYAGGFGLDDNYYSNPMLLLPTETEKTNAYKENGNIVEGYTVGASASGGKKSISDLFKYFSGTMSVTRIEGAKESSRPSSSNWTENGSTGDYTTTGITYKKDQTLNYGDHEPQSGCITNVLGNSALLYYYLEELDDYNIVTDRYSVYEFNKAYKQFNYNETLRKFGKSKGTNIKNSGGSERYVYSPSQLGFTGTSWKNETVTWPDKTYPKYLVDDTTNKIYGERGTAANEVTYYGPTKVVNGVTKNGATVPEMEYYDILVVGFGHTMDYMVPKAVTKIQEYLEKGGPALIGYGAVTRDSNNTLGDKIKNALGMTGGENIGNPNTKSVGCSTMMVTNDTLFAHYPYKVPHYMKNTSCNNGPYKLNIADNPDIVCSFAKYRSDPITWEGANRGYQYWGDSTINYYLYKKGSITYCGFGDTFSNSGNNQRGMVMTLAEVVMVVNALITTSRYKSGGTNDDPYFDCVDVDRGIWVRYEQIGEDDEDEKGIKYDVDDAVYSDYSFYGIAGSTYNDGTAALKSESFDPGNGFPGAKENVRWVKYEANLSVGKAYLTIKTKDGKDVSLDVYKYYYDTHTKSHVYQKVEPSSNQYEISRTGTYYIGVPVLPSAYSSISTTEKLGFNFDKGSVGNNVDRFDLELSLIASGTEIEKHHLNMIRRILYNVD